MRQFIRLEYKQKSCTNCTIYSVLIPKQLLKAANKPVPVSAYDAFDALAKQGKIEQHTLEQWNLAIGLRNRIVHEYMTIDMSLVLQLIIDKHYLFFTDFLCSPININNN